MSAEYKQTKKNIEEAYKLIQTKPEDRLDCISKALQIMNVLSGGIILLTGLSKSPHLHEFTDEELEYVHESFCVSAIPILQMAEHFAEKREREAQKYSLAV